MSERDDEEEPSADLGLTPLGEALSSLLRSRGLSKAAGLSVVMSTWEEVAGPELAKKVRPVGLRGDELLVEVDDPAWATQVSLLSSQLLGRLTERLGHRVATRLVARVKPSSQR